MHTSALSPVAAVAHSLWELHINSGSLRGNRWYAWLHPADKTSFNIVNIVKLRLC